MQNMKQFLLINFFITFIFFAQHSFAYDPKEGNISAMLGPLVYQTAFHGGPDDRTSPLLGGLALIVMGDVSDHGNLEISMFHLNKIYYREFQGDFLAEETELIHISMGYRYWINPYFSTALAFSSGYAIGDPRVLSSRIVTGHEMDTSARDLTEYGFDFSVQGQLWSNGVMAILLDARYTLSVTNKEGEHGDHYGMLLGFRYFVQEKQSHERPLTSPKTGTP